MTTDSAVQETGFALLTIRRLIVPTAFAGLVSYQALSVLPLIVGGLIDHRGFTASQAGMVGSLEVFAMAGTAIILSPKINRIQRHYWAIGASLLLALMQFLSASPSAAGWFYVERFVAGMSSGVLVAILAATIPLARNPERLTALIILFDSSCTMGLYLVMPSLILQYGLTGAYGFLAIMTVLLAPLFLLLPASGPAPTPLSAPMRKTAWRVVAYSMSISIAGTALWSFTERMGVSIGLELTTIGQVFAGSILIGLVGASTAAFIGQKIGSFWPIIIATLFNVSAAIAMPQVSTPLLFVVLFCVLQLSQQFNDPFRTGVTARLDGEGRLIGLSAGTGLLGAAFGPFLAGFIVEDGGFYRLSYLYFVLAAISFTAFWPILWRDRYR